MPNIETWNTKEVIWPAPQSTKCYRTFVGETWSNLGAVERLLQSFSQKLSYLNDIKCHEHVEFQRS